MLIPVEVVTSRHYSFTGDDGRPVNIVEALCLVDLGGEKVAGKINTRGNSALKPGNYQARLRASEKGGKLAITIGDFVAAAPAYAAASGAK